MFASAKQNAGEFSPYSRFVLPAEMGRRFLITVDTEEEFDWEGPFQRSGHTTISVPKLKRFQAFVEKYQIKPVYFVDYSIIENDEASEFLRDIAARDAATIGVHLHPWINPPFEEETNNYNSYAGNLDKQLEKEKLENLHRAIEERIGYKSVIYRAGRYGVGPHSIEILRQLGFAIDSSVRARFDYSGQEGPDFGHIGSEPFWLTPDKDLLEIPLTTVFSGVFRKHGAWLTKNLARSPGLNGILAKSKMLERIPLTPEGVSAREAREAIDMALDDALQLLVFSFHSPSLSPGHTPYVQSSDDLDRFYDWWREVIGHLSESGVSPVSVEELLAVMRNGSSRDPTAEGMK